MQDCAGMRDCTNDSNGVEQRLGAEQRLMEATREGVCCDFANGAKIAGAEMDSWGPERTVRAAVLRRMLDADHPEVGEQRIQLRGAVIEDVLDLKDMTVSGLSLKACRIASVSANKATFSGDASFDDSTFVGYASFDDSMFVGNASFDGATLTPGTSFVSTTFTPGTSFRNTTFVGNASFDGATFVGNASFDGATFVDNAWFDGTTFTGDSSFGRTTFAGDAWFGDTMFTGEAMFARATFTGEALFHRATFTRFTWFGGTTFTGQAGFFRATFTGKAKFDDAIAASYDFREARCHGADLGPWVSRRLTLEGAVFHSPVRLAMSAVETVDCHRLQAREGALLLSHGGTLDLTDAEFLRPSILTHSTSNLSIPERKDPGDRSEFFDQLTPAVQAHWTTQKMAFLLTVRLARDLGSKDAARTRILSLSRATVGDLALSGIGLEDCVFVGAHGLDKLRIDTSCSFQRPPAWSLRTWRPFTARRVISEEAKWRQEHAQGWPVASAPAASGQDPVVPTALEIAGIYRNLRKGREDSKDEPGAADFYYGEMEMRRLADRKNRRRDGDKANHLRSSRVERGLLNAYWVVSGYGLRAWRSLTALTVLLLACAALFTMPLFARLPDPPQQVSSVDLRTGGVRYAPYTQPGVQPHTTVVPLGLSMEFTARESLTLTRAFGTPVLQTTGVGTALDIALRLLAPLLLGLALLAVRGRTKR